MSDVHSTSNTQGPSIDSIDAPPNLASVTANATAENNANQDPPDFDNLQHIRIAPFWKNDPELWFLVLQSQFNLYHITNDEAKYTVVISELDLDGMIAVEDIVTNPPANAKYATIKQRLIERFGLSKSQKIQKLLFGLKLGDRKPSALLREIKYLGKDHISPDVMRCLWLYHLPKDMEMVLAGVHTPDIDELAKTADRIWEVSDRNKLTPPKESNSSNVTLEKRIDNLSSQLEELGKKIDALLQSGIMALRTDNNQEYCYYHRRYGARARKCQLPCGFRRNQGN